MKNELNVPRWYEFVPLYIIAAVKLILKLIAWVAAYCG